MDRLEQVLNDTLNLLTDGQVARMREIQAMSPEERRAFNAPTPEELLEVRERRQRRRTVGSLADWFRQDAADRGPMPT